MTTLTLLHPGSMGAAIGAQLVAVGHRVLWIPDGRSQHTRQRADRAGLTPAPSLRAALSASDIAVAICPPGVAEEIAHEVDELAFSGVYIEANAISPERVLRLATSMTARVVDGSITGPPPPGPRATRLYLAGDPESVTIVEDVFNGADVEVHVAGDTPGAASALKMAFAAFQRPARTLAALAHALADTHGVGDLLMEEAGRMPHDLLSDTAYLPTVAARAWRWGPEMLEVADALRSAGLPGDLAEATASVMRHWDSDKDRPDLPLAEALAHLKRVTSGMPQS
ncbi:NAD(P)-dependent oxidoreductase [Streptomyces sp. UNOC14_S4]|uniref:NAD(P)-dependent oxidoreductase n=1 Tax=Streptomyces sp. UNOC14_S4 TaxID=2872340 RepID=UPI001E4F0A1C|nr:NAD(P)-dependent oxidoreductase [Streptomyces sp. UNOC14_S4]MCC3769014.1 DUF1932 domain-containing protein [Streptomyces sp. UNOC14_S4]